MECFERIENDPGNYQTRIRFIVGGDDVPRRVGGACAAHAVRVGLHIVVPVLPLLDVVETELPVFFRLLQALEKALALFLPGEVQEELDDARSVAVQVRF